MSWPPGEEGPVRSRAAGRHRQRRGQRDQAADRLRHPRHHPGPHPARRDPDRVRPGAGDPLRDRGHRGGPRRGMGPDGRPAGRATSCGCRCPRRWASSSWSTSSSTTASVRSSSTEIDGRTVFHLTCGRWLAGGDRVLRGTVAGRGRVHPLLGRRTGGPRSPASATPTRRSCWSSPSLDRLGAGELVYEPGRPRSDGASPTSTAPSPPQPSAVDPYRRPFRGRPPVADRDPHPGLSGGL